MARPAAHSNTLLARVRRYYGLGQHELADLLGIAPPLASRIEAGARALTREVHARLAPFLAQMPAEPAPPPPAPPAGPFDAAPLAARRAACLHEAANLRWRVRALPAQAQHAAHWAQALPALRTALGPLPAPTTLEAVRLRFVHAWLDVVPPTLPPADLAAWHLAEQRALALEAEAAALEELLAGAGGNRPV